MSVAALCMGNWALKDWIKLTSTSFRSCLHSKGRRLNKLAVVIITHFACLRMALCISLEELLLKKIKTQDPKKETAHKSQHPRQYNSFMAKILFKLIVEISILLLQMQMEIFTPGEVAHPPTTRVNVDMVIRISQNFLKK